MSKAFTAGRLHKQRRCQRPGSNATSEQLAAYRKWRKQRTYWSNLPQLVTGVLL